MIVSLCEIIFMYDHRYYNPHRAINFVKSQIILKLPAVESCAYLSELPGTEFECSIILINGPTWSAMREERILLF